MRKTIFAAIFLVFVFMGGACANTRVTLPSFSGFLGLGSKTPVFVNNATPFYAKLVVLNEEIGVIEPGASVYDRCFIDFGYMELPCTAFMYVDSDCANLVGIAGTSLRIRSGQPADWVIRAADINYLGTSSINSAIDDSISLFSSHE